MQFAAATGASVTQPMATRKKTFSVRDAVKVVPDATVVIAVLKGVVRAAVVVPHVIVLAFFPPQAPDIVAALACTVTRHGAFDWTVKPIEPLVLNMPASKSATVSAPLAGVSAKPLPGVTTNRRVA